MAEVKEITNRSIILVSCATYNVIDSGVVSSKNLYYADMIASLSRLFAVKKDTYVGDYLQLLEKTFETENKKRNLKAKLIITAELSAAFSVTIGGSYLAIEIVDKKKNTG